MASPVLEHPTIGRVHGVLGKGVRRFLGVQYASLKDRLAEPEEIQVYDGRDIDATKLGYVEGLKLVWWHWVLYADRHL